MKKLSTKKKIGYAIAAVVLVLAVAAVVVYFLVAQNKTSAPSVASEVPLSETPNLGACQLTSPEKIKNSELAGGFIKSVSEGTRIGIKSPEGTVADACRYTFSTSSSSDNTITVAAYEAPVRTQEAPANTPKYSWSEAAGTSPKMYFAEQKTESDKKVIDIVQQPLGGSILLLTIEQSTSTLTFPKGAAQWFLADIATNANTAVIESTKAKVDTAENGDGPGTPPANTKVETLKPTN